MTVAGGGAQRGGGGAQRGSWSGTCACICVYVAGIELAEEARGLAKLGLAVAETTLGVA